MIMVVVLLPVLVVAPTTTAILLLPVLVIVAYQQLLAYRVPILLGIPTMMVPKKTRHFEITRAENASRKFKLIAP
jgi:hypothetical protein